MSLDAWLESYCEHEQREPEVVNLLWRILHEGQVQRPPPSHRVLCLDAPRHVRAMRVMVGQLPWNERICIWMKFSYPIRDDTGQQYTGHELAGFLGISKVTFNRFIRSGKKRIYHHIDRAAA